MNYFVTKEELLEEIGKAVSGIFDAVVRLLSEEDVKLNKRLRKMERDFLLLINVVGGNVSHQKNNKKKEKKMEEERVVRPFDEVLAELFDYILQSEDHDLIILADELQKSAKESQEAKEKVKKRLREMFLKGEAFLKEQEGEKKGKG